MQNKIFEDNKVITYGLKMILKFVGFCWHSVFCSIYWGLCFI